MPELAVPTRDPDGPSKVLNPGFGARLDADRSVECYRTSCGGYVWKLTRKLDGKPKDTIMRVSPEAFYAMVAVARKMIEAYPAHAASTEMALAAKKPSKPRKKSRKAYA